MRSSRSSPAHLVARLPAAALPHTCTAPMLATLGAMPTALAAFGYEVKWDGYRALAQWDGATFRLCSRHGHDLSRRFAEIVALSTVLRQPILLDGEIVAINSAGQPSFSALQTRMPRPGAAAAERSWDSRHYQLHYMIFDILHYAGKSTCSLPYVDRRQLLERLGLAGPAWQVPPMHPDGPALLTVMKQAGQEGIIAKRLDSPYRPGRRSGDWIKIKLHREEAFLIAGYWTSGATPVGSLLLAAYATAADVRARRQPRFCGKVGTGFSAQDRIRLHRLLRPLAVSTPSAQGRLPRADGITWCRPTLIAQIRFGEWTHANQVRHPRFLGLRSDLTRMDVVHDRLRAS